MSDNPLHILMNPQSIAIVGASNSPFKMATFQAKSIINSGYKGKIYPLHPKERNVLGYKAYRTAADLPEPPDIAFLVVPTAQVIPLMEEFGKIGTRRAVIVTAGFREMGAEGIKLEEELLAIADKYCIRFLGPNCIGLINTRASLNTTPAGQEIKPGILGFASQSGTWVGQTASYLRRKGIRLSKAISLGNEANIDGADALEYLGEDEDTKAIILYIEGIRDGQRFIEVARKITPHKPVLALYAGGSAAGARSGMSHTGAMAGPDRLYDGIFKQAGVLRVPSIEELYSHGWALATQPFLQGNRLGVVTNSGGPGTTIVDTANKVGFEVPQFSDSLQREIRPLLSSHAPSGNPVDLTFHINIDVLSTTIPEIIMKSGEVDALIVYGVFDFLNEQNPSVLSGSAALPHIYGKPMFVTSFFDWQDAYTAYYQDQNIPVFEIPEKASMAMAALLRYREVRMRKAIETPVLPEPSPAATASIQAALQKGQTGLDEYESKKILAAYGIPVTRERLTATADEVLAAAREIGFPAALKGCSWEIMHKTEKRLIRLGLKEEEIMPAFRAIRKAGGENNPVIVQEMIQGNRELAMGMTRFPGFGPVLLFGLGGIFTEALQDNAFRLAPLSLTEAEEMIHDIRATKMLKEFRGMPDVNVPALADILQRLAFIAILHPEIAEMDLNPLIISGSTPTVADALIILKA